jgi:hypothetical protein
MIDLYFDTLLMSASQLLATLTLVQWSECKTERGSECETERGNADKRGGGETSGASVPGALRGVVSSRQASSALVVRDRAESALSVPPPRLYNQVEGGSLPPAHIYTPPSPFSHVPPSYSPHYSSSHQVSPQAVPSRFRTTLSFGAYRPLSTFSPLWR